MDSINAIGSETIKSKYSYINVMKKILFTILFALLIQNSSSQWVSQNIPGTLNFLNGLDFYNTQTGAVGGWGFGAGFSATGRALYTTNGGANWIYAFIPDSLRVIVAVQYIDAQNVYGFGVKNITTSSYNSPDLPARYNFRNKFEVRRNITLYPRGSGVTRGYLLKSSNGGQSWQYYAALPTEVLYFHDGVFLNSTTGFGAANVESNLSNKTGVVRSTNSGLNWNFVSYPDSLDNIQRITFSNSTTGFAAGEHLDTSVGFKGLILRSTNGGNNWSRTKFPTINNFTGISFTNSTTGLACGTSNDPIPGAHYYKTTNGGASWFKLPFQVDTAYSNGINLTEGTGRGFAFGQKFEADPQNPGSFIQTGSFINRTTDYGQTWHKFYINDNEGTLINSSDIDQNTWYISGGNFFTERGIVLKTTNGGGPIGISSISTEVPSKFVLYQNYPNPFNPVTKIRFDVPESGNIIFNVYDVLGKIIYSLNEDKSSGTYEITFDGNDLASGIYYYSLNAAGNSEVKKMVLLK